MCIRDSGTGPHLRLPPRARRVGRRLCAKLEKMQTRSGDFELTMDELRAIAGYAVACAEPALVLFQKARPDDPRPAAALHAARVFAEGAPRSRLQRTAAADAHRAARDATTEAARHAASAAGDAAAAASPAALAACRAASVVASLAARWASAAAVRWRRDRGAPSAKTRAAWRAAAGRGSSGRAFRKRTSAGSAHATAYPATARSSSIVNSKSPERVCISMSFAQGVGRPLSIQDWSQPRSHGPRSVFGVPE